jgi:uncharacterized protein YggE
MKQTFTRTLIAAGLSAAILFGAAAVSAPAWSNYGIVRAQEATATPVPADSQPTEPTVVPPDGDPTVVPSGAQNLPRTITVVGDGTVNIKPDVARANIGVEVLRPSVDEAAAENNEVTEQVLAALKEMGIAEEDIQTSGYSVFSERYSPDGSPATEVQYRVTNTVNVLIRNLDNVGAILDASIKAGANNIYGVEFLLDDPTAPRSAAREMAVENAAATATELAELTGVEVGPIVSISEVIGNNGGFYSNQFTQYSTGMGGGRMDAPIEPGQLRLTMQLQVTYELVD